jgi:hypothetical protein
VGHDIAPAINGRTAPSRLCAGLGGLNLVRGKDTEHQYGDKSEDPSFHRSGQPCHSLNNSFFMGIRLIKAFSKLLKAPYLIHLLTYWHEIE